MKFALPLKDWIGYAIMLIAVTASYASTNANQDKDMAVVNTKLDAMLSNQTTMTSTVGLMAGDIVNLKIDQGKTDIRISQLETLAAPMLANK